MDVDGTAPARSPGWLRWLLGAEVALALLVGVFLALAPGMFSDVQPHTPAVTVVATAFGPALLTFALALLARAAWRRQARWLTMVLTLVPPAMLVAAFPVLML